MEIFKILGTVAVDGMDKAEKGLTSLGNVATKVGKVMAAGLAAGATAVGALAKNSLDAYAEYEQLIGGTELMFGDAFDFVKDKAANAYSAVQMSQNDYLQQVNGFATGLKTSLNGNAQAAAELADKIITAEADIVAATGNSQEAVQNAFNGIMKSNYTMLDNLQLGITPTKEGFQEVIDKVNEWNKANGEATNYQISNLADCQSALVDYVEMQGLAGYAGNEAAGSISGSLASTKAAWQNLLTGFADDSQDLGVLVDNVVGSATTAVHNIVPRLAEILSGISQAMTQIMPIIAAELPVILQELLPGVISGAVALVNGLVASLPAILGILIAQFPSVFTQISEGLIQTFPVLLETARNLFGQIFDFVSLELLNSGVSFEDFCNKVQWLFQGAWTVMQTVWETIGQPVFDFITEGVGFLRDLFAQYMPEIQAFVGQCFTDILTFWNAHLKPCLYAIGNFLETVLLPVFQTVFQGTIGPLIDTVFNGIKNTWETVLKPVFTGITDFLTGVFTGDWEKAWQGIEDILKGILNGILTGIETTINGAIDIINGLIKGINDLTVVEAISKALGVDGIPLVEKVTIPKLEEGGILAKGQMGFLEGNGAEAVVPLDQNKAWISAVARDMESAGIGGNSQQTQRIIELLEALVETLPDTMKEAFASMKIEFEKREVARMVKAVG